jgi:hypothetical protein
MNQNVVSEQSMDFQKRLERAINRGRQAADAEGREAAAAAQSEEDLRNLHGKLRLDLSEHIEQCLRALTVQVAGFQYKSVIGAEGWGARISRDDVVRSGGKRESTYTRFEMVVKPFSDAHIVEITTKGTIRNRETLKRSHYQFLNEADIDSMKNTIDLWVLEFAEEFAKV